MRNSFSKQLQVAYHIHDFLGVFLPVKCNKTVSTDLNIERH